MYLLGMIFLTFAFICFCLKGIPLRQKFCKQYICQYHEAEDIEETIQNSKSRSPNARSEYSNLNRL